MHYGAFRVVALNRNVIIIFVCLTCTPSWTQSTWSVSSLCSILRPPCTYIHLSMHHLHCCDLVPHSHVVSQYVILEFVRVIRQQWFNRTAARFPACNPIEPPSANRDTCLKITPLCKLFAASSCQNTRCDHPLASEKLLRRHVKVGRDSATWTFFWST